MLRLSFLYRRDLLQLQCLAGQYDAGASVCTDCTTVAPGFYCPAGGTNPAGTACTAGYACPGGTAPRVQCSAGQFSAAGASSCGTCTAGAGAYCPAGCTTAAGVACPAGSKCAGGASQPVLCLPGPSPVTGRLHATAAPHWLFKLRVI